MLRTSLATLCFTGLAALAAPALAMDCPAEKLGYELRPSGESFNIGMPPTARFNIGMPPGDAFNIGMPPTLTFLPAGKVASGMKAQPITVGGKKFVRVSDLTAKSEVYGGDIAVFAGREVCGK